MMKRQKWSLYKGSLVLGLVLLGGSKGLSNTRGAQVLAEQETISADLIQAYDEEQKHKSQFDPSVLVPNNATTMNGQQVAKAMADKSLQLWWNSESVKTSSLGSRADKVERQMQQDVTVQEKNGVAHKFTFQVKPIQTTASVDYTGYTNARLYYQATEAESGVEVFEDVGKNKKVTLAQIAKSQESVSQVSWSMSW